MASATEPSCRLNPSLGLIMWVRMIWLIRSLDQTHECAIVTARSLLLSIDLGRDDDVLFIGT